MKSFFNYSKPCYLIALAFYLLAGCAVDNQQTDVHGAGLSYRSNVRILPDGNNYIEVEAAPLAGRQSGAETIATNQANKFCADHNQKVVVVNKEFDSLLLVNGVVRLTFKCE